MLFVVITIIIFGFILVILEIHFFSEFLCVSLLRIYLKIYLLLVQITD